MGHDAIDVDYTNVKNNKKYYTLDEVKKELNVEEHTIIFWFNKFNDMLNIQTIGIYQIFDEYDVKNLKQIKELNIDKKMNIDEIRAYLTNHKDSIIVKQKNENEVNIINIFSEIITIQNKKIDEILLLQKSILESNNILVDSQKELREKIIGTIDEIVADKLEEHSTQLQQKFQAIIDENEKKATERDVKMTDNLNKIMEDRKKQYKEQNTKKHESLWNKISDVFRHEK